SGWSPPPDDPLPRGRSVPSESPATHVSADLAAPGPGRRSPLGHAPRSLRAGSVPCRVVLGSRGPGWSLGLRLDLAHGLNLGRDLRLNLRLDLRRSLHLDSRNRFVPGLDDLLHLLDDRLL